MGNTKNNFSEIQKNLVKFGGTQCGYCSPGMVMNMFRYHIRYGLLSPMITNSINNSFSSKRSLLNGEGKLTKADVEDSFSGNLCRCTGYRSILDAFKSMASDAPKELKQGCIDIEDIASKPLCPKASGLISCRESCTSEVNFDQPPISKSLRVSSTNAKWFRVRSVAEIFEILELDSVLNYMILAGNTAQGK